MARARVPLPVVESAVASDEPNGSHEDVLLRDGWTRRFTAAPPRLDEVTTLYVSLGYEIHLEPLGAGELPPACGDCPAALVLARVVYTRRPTRAT